MRRRIALSVVCLLIVWAIPARLAAAQRIVSLKPNVTEILFAIGAGDRVVGVTRWCNFPPAAAALPKVADYLRPNIEAVLALEPDLLIASRENSIRRPVERLANQGIEILLLDFRTIDETLTSITHIGHAVGRDTAASHLVRQMRMALVPVTRDGHTRPRTLLLIDHHPLVAAGPSSLLGEMIERAGGTNVIAARHPPYPILGREHLLALQPELVIDVAHQGLGRSATDLSSHHLNMDHFRPGPRLVEGFTALRTTIGGTR
jgi:iron complex transport system substrate-binding protein